MLLRHVRGNTRGARRYANSAGNDECQIVNGAAIFYSFDSDAFANRLIYVALN